LIISLEGYPHIAVMGVDLGLKAGPRCVVIAAVVGFEHIRLPSAGEFPNVAVASSVAPGRMAATIREVLAGTAWAARAGAGHPCRETAMARLRRWPAPVLGMSVWPRGLRVPGRCARPFLVTGGWLSAGAVLTGLILLGALVPASAQTLTWTIVPSPNAGVNNNSLGGVSCASATACMAVGYYYNSSSISRTLTEAWDGTSWTGVPSRNPGPASDSSLLTDVSCVSATACTAVGWSLVSESRYKTLVESWDGTKWSVVHAPNPATAGGNALFGVSCVSAAACTAVGYSLISGDLYRTLIESWDGTSWTVVPSRNPVSGDDYLYGVSCTTAAACTAVGHTFNGGVSQTLIESWDGTSWTVVQSPSAANDSLGGVSCASATACMAVGTTGADQTLIESWDGTSWTIVPSPKGSGIYSALGGVSCTSPTACTAVGDSGTETLIESWDGTSWTVVPSPNRGPYGSVLGGISCVSATACTAAGFSKTKSDVYRTLNESGTASS
jgi:hypothetical protein